MSIKIISDWYEDQKNIDEMNQWDKGKLKIWEEKAAGLFPPGAKVLDIGCGLGREAFALCEKNFDVTGIDISQGVIDEVRLAAKRNKHDIPFLCYKGRELPFNDDSFDAVIIWAQTFGLLYGDDYKKQFLAECRRVLKENGLLSFSGHDFIFLSENYKEYLVGRKFYPYANTQMYWETFLKDELSSFAQEAGFTVILCEQGEIYKPEDGIVLHCLCRK